ncbi:MAG: class I SAM-dependent rRNA methyltransferase [Myxococcota bacterium]
MSADESRGGRGDGRGGSGRGRGSKSRPRPIVRGRGVKVGQRAASNVRAGHPWVFRDSILRDVDALAPGATVQVCDEDGIALGWGLVEPEGAVAVRVVGGPGSEARWDAETILLRVRAAVEARATLPEAVSGACRLVHGEGDGLPGVAVDRLGDYLLIYKYSRSAEPWLDDLVEALQTVVAPAGIYMQDRLKSVTPEDRRPPAFHLKGERAPPEIVVTEDGLSFHVDPSAPVSPGLFLDLREGRRWAERLAPGKRVLNLFSFTGSFGLRAVRAGAAEVVNVDAAARSHAKCRQNLAASGFDPEACEGVVADVFGYLERMRQRQRDFDLVIVDPPPFSRTKDVMFSALRHWGGLMEAVAGVVAPGGQVLAVSNASRLSEDELMYGLGGGAAAAKREARLTGECGLPEDFPVPAAFTEGRYLKIKLLRLP